eukprot:COSAG06_NODE_1436_length_9466_cov_4.920038_3_plen_313_part_00
MFTKPALGFCGSLGRNCGRSAQPVAVSGGRAGAWQHASVPAPPSGRGRSVAAQPQRRSCILMVYTVPQRRWIVLAHHAVLRDSVRARQIHAAEEPRERLVLHIWTARSTARSTVRRAASQATRQPQPANMLEPGGAGLQSTTKWSMASCRGGGVPRAVSAAKRRAASLAGSLWIVSFSALTSTSRAASPEGAPAAAAAAAARSAAQHSASSGCRGGGTGICSDSASAFVAFGQRAFLGCRTRAASIGRPRDRGRQITDPEWPARPGPGATLKNSGSKTPSQPRRALCEHNAALPDHYLPPRVHAPAARAWAR